MIHDELKTPSVLNFINLLIKDENIVSFSAISKKDKAHLMSLAYKSDNAWAYEALGNNDHWNAIKSNIANVIKYHDKSFDSTLCDILREIVPDYFEPHVEAIFDQQLAEWRGV